MVSTGANTHLKMTEPDWERIKDVFTQVSEQPESLQLDLLREACAGDASLFAEVESLLAASHQSENLMDQDRYSAASIFPKEKASIEGRRFGPYKVVREIGRGGMGAVYLARREDAEYRKFVAIKVVRPEFETAEIVRRFRNERQILAGLDHPNIARLLDGGATDEGLPYLVMEYVEGRPIADYCDERRLTTRERLDLLMTVCAAVQHAHQNLVVHRDLKPSNILITTDGVPKLLDFGIAKVLNPELSALSMESTQTVLRMLTPEYASPEQVRGEKLTTASDIYSLGVVLYELLSGHRPYRATATTTPQALARVICEQEPTKPSTAVGSVEVIKRGDGDAQKTITPESVGRARDTEPGKLQRRLSGDLDNIVLKALRKEPQRRYGSAAELSADIQRHLDGLPVIARKDTFRYRATKFVRRNRISVSAVALVLISLVGGLAVSLYQSRKAHLESIRAQREQTKASAINDFLKRMLAASNPAVNMPGTKGRATTLADVLDIAAARLDSQDLASQPEVKAELHQIIGWSYLSQGRYDLAEKHLLLAEGAQRQLFGDKSPEVLQTLVSLASLAVARADYQQADKIYKERLGILRAEYAQGRIGSETLLAALNDFAVLLRARGDSREAERLLREAASVISQLPAEARKNHEGTQAVLALTLMDQGKFDEAKSYSRELLAQVRLQSGDTQALCAALTMMGSVLMETGELDEADADLREAETLYRKLFDPSYLPLYDNLRLQAQVLYLKGNYVEAETKIDQTIENYRASSKPQYINYATALTTKGLILNKLGKSAAAEIILREALRLRTEYLPKEHFMTALTRSALGECLTNEKRFDEASSLLLESYESLKISQGEQNPRTVLAKIRLEKFYEEKQRA
jgi:eukaryotic-like serine/threonine-protein kinase